MVLYKNNRIEIVQEGDKYTVVDRDCSGTIVEVVTKDLKKAKGLFDRWVNELYGGEQ